MCYILVVLVIAIAVLVVLHSRKNHELARQAWQDVAHEFGLACRPGSGFRSPSLAGTIDGLHVTVDVHTRGSGDDSSTWTRYRVTYPSLRMSLKLTREVPLFSSVARAFGGQDVVVGAKEFDDRVVVRARDAATVRAYLTPARQQAIRTFLTTFSHAVIGDSAASSETSGFERSRERLASRLRSVLALTRALQDDGGARRPADEAPSSPPAPKTPARQRPPPLPVPPLLPRARARTPTWGAATAALAGVLGAAADAREAEQSTHPPAPPEPSAPPEPPGNVPPCDEQQPVYTPVDDISGPDHPTPVASRQDDVCTALFAGSGALSDAHALFDEEYKGLFVHWTGTLRTVRHAYSESAFGSGEFTRAELAIGRVSAGVFGEREVRAVVQFPVELRHSLEGRDGAELTFEGDLVAIDPFMRQVFVARATEAV